jgi:hypothetical protein
MRVWPSRFGESPMPVAKECFGRSLETYPSRIPATSLRDTPKTPMLRKALFYWGKVVRPERVELPTFWFVARRSIQLSYGRTAAKLHPEAKDVSGNCNMKDSANIKRCGYSQQAKIAPLESIPESSG